MDLTSKFTFSYLYVMMVHMGVLLMAAKVPDVTGSSRITPVEDQAVFLTESFKNTSAVDHKTHSALKSMQSVHFSTSEPSPIFSTSSSDSIFVSAPGSANVTSAPILSSILSSKLPFANGVYVVSSQIAPTLSSVFHFSPVSGGGVADRLLLNGELGTSSAAPALEHQKQILSRSTEKPTVSVVEDITRRSNFNSNDTSMASKSAFFSFLEFLAESSESNRTSSALLSAERFHDYSFDSFADDLASFVAENEGSTTIPLGHHELDDVLKTVLMDSEVVVKPSVSVSTAVSTSTSTRVFARSSNRKQRRKQTGYQDIISGLVKLLGGKNVLIANSKPASSGSTTTDKLAVSPSRLNHRAPPKITFADPAYERPPVTSGMTQATSTRTSSFQHPSERPPATTSRYAVVNVLSTSTENSRITQPSDGAIHPSIAPSEPTLASDTASTVVHNATENLPSGPITEWLPARGSHPVGFGATLPKSDVSRPSSLSTATKLSEFTQVAVDTISSSSVSTAVKTTEDSHPAVEVSYAEVVPSKTRGTMGAQPESSLTTQLHSSTRKTSKTPEASESATPPLPAHPSTSEGTTNTPVSRGTVMAVPNHTLTSSRAPSTPGGGTSSFGTSPNREPTGSPFVIPVDIQHIRLGDDDSASGPIFGGPHQASSSQSVYINGRKTYFNLMPTETHGGSDSTLVNVGVGYSFPTNNRPPVSQGSVSSVKLPNAPRPGLSRPQPSRNSPANHKTPIRIDTCIIGDEKACNAQLNETCRVESGVSSCNCRLGYGRDGLEHGCKPVVRLVVYIKVDRVHNEVISFGPEYENPSAEKYQILEYEAKNAVDSVFSLSALAESYTGCVINSFFPIGGRVIINATVNLLESPQTRSPTIKQEIRRGLISVIRQQQQQNIGQSSLYVDGPLNPIPGVQDLDECADENLNDCSKNAVCKNSFGAFKCTCLEDFLDKYSDDPRRNGRICSVCSPQYCNNRGECVITNGQKECRCQGNYIGAQCETDGEVLGVALGASLAALVIIGLTFVCLCMWSRRWKQVQQKVIGRPSSGGFGNSYNYFNKSSPQPDFQLPLEDRIRWPQASEQNDNFYAQPEPIIPGCNPKTYTASRPPLPSAPPPSSNIHKLVQPLRSLPAPLTGSRSNILDDTDEDDHGNPDTATNPNTRFHFPRPKSRPMQTGHNNIYYDVSFPNCRDHCTYDQDYGTINAFPMKNMRPLHS